MVTLVEKLPTTFTGSNAATMKRLTRVDRLESSGSLLLIDPTHEANPWASGVPADHAVIPNILADTGIYGNTAAARDAKLRVPAAFTGTAGKIERTGRGGLHGISPQAGTAVLQSGPSLGFPIELMRYILANPDHRYYMGYWGRITRGVPSTGYSSHGIISINGNGQQTNSFLFSLSMNPTAATKWNARPTEAAEHDLGHTENPYNSQPGNKFLAKASAGWLTTNSTKPNALPGDGTEQAVTGSYAGGCINWGSSLPMDGIGATGTTGTGVFNAGAASTTTKDTAPSHILYRLYLEDLTVSGRSHADVAAIDHALYTEEVLTDGGRYYADTFTDPATLP